MSRERGWSIDMGFGVLTGQLLNVIIATVLTGKY